MRCPMCNIEIKRKCRICGYTVLKEKRCWYCGEYYPAKYKRCPYCNRLWRTQYKIGKNEKERDS
jgi:hypothetical protein